MVPGPFGGGVDMSRGLGMSGGHVKGSAPPWTWHTTDGTHPTGILSCLQPIYEPIPPIIYIKIEMPALSATEFLSMVVCEVFSSNCSSCAIKSFPSFSTLGPDSIFQYKFPTFYHYLIAGRKDCGSNMIISKLLKHCCALR